MEKADKLLKSNVRLAKRRWGALGQPIVEALRSYSRQFRFSLATGDLLLLDAGWYVTNAGLTRLARRSRCAGINVKPVEAFCDPVAQRWAFEATVYKSRGCRGFVGYGDADPSNVSPLVRGAEMRVAETRAVNRALRKAYGIGICSVEELGATSGAVERSSEARKRPPQPSNGNGWDSGPRVRDRLCLLIRQHRLDPELVKAYAIDFCGTKTLKEATRAQVEGFVEHLGDWAEKDRNALLCQLNSYFRVNETQDNQAPKQDGAA
jgi:hypothetical protein